jgi:phenylalanyl-tRNA synthetase alpha chain
MTSYITRTQLAEDLALRDLSDPTQGPHALQLILANVVDALRAAWSIATETVRHSPVVPVENNYDRLGFDAAAVTRDQRYSRYLSPTVMLRSHTSASVPWLLGDLARLHDVDKLVAMPGLVYRRDAIDRTHVGAPHQVDLWRIASHPALDEVELEKMIGIVVDAVLPGATWRTVPAVHPYTTAGRQVDVLVNGEWLELAECGLVAPALFNRAGASSDEWSGLALGMGLDRALMLRKGIDDIRLLRSDDPRIRTQMLDLAPWQPVSMMPPIRRDISIVVAEGSDTETLGDAVRSALGERVDDLESVEVLAVTGYEALPLQARERLAMRPDQMNALLRINLRPLSRTMTDDEANELRDVVYRAVHDGSVMELIGSRDSSGRSVDAARW